MARLDKERQEEFEPKRITYAKQQLEKLGIIIDLETKTELRFTFKGETIRFFPYSGWHSGKSIVDGRGIEKLLKQLK